MATLKKIIEFVDGVKPNAFTPEQKTEWINEVEGYVQSEVMLIYTPDLLLRYDWAQNQDTELLVLPPHDKLYRTYLAAMIDFYNQEYDHYQNAMTLYNAQMGEFKKWFLVNYHPADRPCGGE